MTKKPLYWKGKFLADICVYDLSDWKGNSLPGKSDFENINIYQSTISLYEALKNVPYCPNEEERESPEPWIKKVLFEICKTLSEDPMIFGEKVMRNYLQTYGMNQVLLIHGVDVNDAKEHIDNMIKEDQ